jgi:hypothetical protein
MFQILKGPKDLQFEILMGAELMRMRATWRTAEGTPGKAVVASVARDATGALEWVRTAAHQLACHVQKASGTAVELGW